MRVLKEVFGVGLLLEKGGEGCMSALNKLAVKREEVSSLGRLHHFDSNQWSVAGPRNTILHLWAISPFVPYKVLNYDKFPSYCNSPSYSLYQGILSLSPDSYSSDRTQALAEPLL